LPELYLHGLAHGDFDLALRGLLGAAAPLSAASIGRLKASWQAEYETWKRRRLDDLEPVYVWADGIYVKAGLEKGKAGISRRRSTSTTGASSSTRSPTQFPDEPQPKMTAAVTHRIRRRALT